MEYQVQEMYKAEAWQRSFFSGMRLFFSHALVCPMLPFRAVDFEPLAMVTMALAISALMICWRPLPHPRVSAVAGLALFCLVVLVAVQYGQSLRLPHNSWEHQAWSYVRALVGPVDGAASVTPEQTRADIITWSPLLSFVVALHLFTHRREALLLFLILAGLIAGVAALSLCQFLFAPMSLGFETKTAYIGSLTGFYVNRNSAGTFFGMGIVIHAGLMVFYLRSSGLAAFTRRLLMPVRLSRSERTSLYLLAGLLVEILALAATQSRGATLSVFMALVTLAWLLSRRKQPRQRSRVRWGRFAMTVGLISVAGVIVTQEAIYRMGAQSVDQARVCTYASTLQAVWDNWPVGSGFGSFADIFPAYRSPQCSGIEGVWDAAHNSYLEGALGLGVTFVAVLGVALASLAWAFAIGLRERRSYRFAPAIGVASLVLVATHSLIDFSMQIPGNALVFAALLAGCVTVSLEGRRSSNRIAQKSRHVILTECQS